MFLECRDFICDLNVTNKVSTFYFQMVENCQSPKQNICIQSPDPMSRRAAMQIYRCVCQSNDAFIYLVCT